MAKKKLDGYGIVAGIIVYGLAAAAALGGLFILWWGEDQTSRYRALNAEALRAVVEMPDISRRDPALDGKLVHATGKAECQSELKDPLFDVSAKAFVLKRHVRFYQLVEHTKKKKDDSGNVEVSHTYEKSWTQYAVSFSKFTNAYQKNKARPPIAAVKGLSLAAGNVTFGAYRLPEFLVASVRSAKALKPALTEEKRKILLQKLGIPGSLLHETDEGLYFGADPGSPQLGDVRVFFTAVPLSEVSILARVRGDSFERFRSEVGPENVNIGEITPGAVSARDMLGEVEINVAGGAWLVRGLGALLTIAGCFFLPWDSLTGLSGVRLLLNGSTARNRSWKLGSVARLALAMLLLVAGLTWLLNGAAAVGGTLLAAAAVMLLLPCVRPRKAA